MSNQVKDGSNQRPKRECSVYAEVCITVQAASPKEAVELFENSLDKAFGEYNINDAICVTDEETGIEQDNESEVFELED